MSTVAQPAQHVDPAAEVDVVVGIDTHRDTHHVEIATPTGVVLASLQVGNDPAGFAAVLTAIGSHAPGPRVLVGIEGTRSYGIGIARALSGAGLPVVEIERPARSQRRGRGKSDPIDAHLAVLTLLRTPAAKLLAPRADGDREALRILLGARTDMVTNQTAQTNRLHALLLTGTDTDRQLGKGRFTRERLTLLRRRRVPADASREHAVRHAEVRRLAFSLLDIDHALRDNRKSLDHIVTEIAPDLLTRPGIGPVSAAQILVSYSHPGRVRNDAAFAALAGTAPQEASSGKTVRHRLNRGGDRALNRAIHTIALTRMRADDRTRAYVERRRAQGKTDREIRRCLKRYITRELYRALTPTTT